MIYTQMTVRAMCLAYDAHRGQVDKGGVPYIFHPIHLAEQMEEEVSATVALLHDVAEDTDWTLEALARHFPPEVMEPLGLLTHEEGVPYEAYVRAIRQNPIAVKVKLADLRHNSDQTRLPNATPQQRHRLQQKYQNAIRILLES